MCSRGRRCRSPRPRSRRSCDRDVADVRAELARAATFEPVGGDGYWALPARAATSAPVRGNGARFARDAGGRSRAGAQPRRGVGARR